MLPAAKAVAAALARATPRPVAKAVAAALAKATVLPAGTGGLGGGVSGGRRSQQNVAVACSLLRGNVCIRSHSAPTMLPAWRMAHNHMQIGQPTTHRQPGRLRQRWRWLRCRPG